MKTHEIISILNKAIPIEDSWVKEEYGPYNIKDKNKEVKNILYCVTATRDVIKYFRENKYDLLISHHPYIAPMLPQLVYHTALDCCKDGLNDMWAKALNLQNANHFDRNLGWVGEIEPISFNDLVAKVEQFIDHKIIGFSATDGAIIKSVVICTGLGGLVFGQAENTKADCYITGELMFPSIGRFKSVIEVGHTLTEFMGIDLLRTLLPDVQIDNAPLNIDCFGLETSIRVPFHTG